MKYLNENWSETKEALLDGLSASKRKIVAPLLDNQKDFVLKENAADGSTRGGDIAGFRKIMIPMIRRIIPGSIASELVGVQPMQGPVSLAYSMRYKYAEGPVTGRDANGNAVTIQGGSEAFGNDHYDFASNPIYNFYSGGMVSGSPSATSGQAPGASGIGPGSPGTIEKDGSGATASGEAWFDVAGESALDGCTAGGHGGGLEGSGGRRMTMEVVSQAVEAGSRKLQAGWSIEAMQDLDAQHGLDLENEMTQALSAEIIQEIDAEVIGDLLALAGTTSTFNGGTTSQGGITYTPNFVGDRFANLGAQINYVANEIARKTRRGAGNYIVVSPMMVSVLQTAAKSVFAPAVAGSFKGPNNTELVGTLNGTIKVYSYLWNSVQSTDIAGSPTGAGDTSILVGYKGGNGETDAGYFYCPYIPLMSSGVVVNPLTYQPAISLMTRYGKAIFTNSATSLGNSADYYGKINVTDLTFA